MANSTLWQNKWKPIVEPRRAKPKKSSSPNPLVKALRRGRHWVWGPNRRRAIKESNLCFDGKVHAYYVSMYFMFKFIEKR